MKRQALSPFDLESMDLLVEAVADPGYGVFPDLLSPEVQQNLVQLMADKVAADTLVRAGGEVGIFGMR